MAGVNKVILVGNLGRDPELRYTQQGTAVANFSLATSESFKKKDGTRDERTEWHRIVVWGQTAEFCSQYLSKGRTVYIEGRLQTREWENKEGQKQKTTEIVAQEVRFVGPRNEGGGNRPPGGGSRPAGADGASGDSPPPADDDIPF